jgi:hypothetical protein
VAPTTHTIELSQIRELNNRLRPHRADRQDAAGITAEMLEVERSHAGEPALRTIGSQTRLPLAATLHHVQGEGPPDYPYIVGAFEESPGSPPAAYLEVSLHTGALRRLSRILGCHHIWGA